MAKIVFTVAGVWGVILLAPLYFMFDLIGRQDPPPITHPAFFYGFTGLGLACQVAFFVIARDPVRFRPMTIPSILKKAGYGGAVVVRAGPQARPESGLRSGRPAVRGAVRGRVCGDRAQGSETSGVRVISQSFTF